MTAATVKAGLEVTVVFARCGGAVMATLAVSAYPGMTKAGRFPGYGGVTAVAVLVG
jgi:hypothetical protein